MKYSDRRSPYARALAAAPVLLSLFFAHPSPRPTQAAVELDGLYAPEERDIQPALDQEFTNMGARAYVIPGTPLYLYKAHQSRYYNVNRHGFRGPAPSPEKKNRYTIMVMGGSAVFGYYQADDQTIPAQLQEILREKYPDCPIEVHNLGIEGYTFRREIALARRMKDVLKPDLVIFYTGYNDLSAAYFYGYPEIQPFAPDAAKDFAISQKKNYLGALIDLVNWMREKVEWPITDKKLEERGEAFVKGFLNDARSIRDELKEDRTAVLFVFQPSVFAKQDKSIRQNMLVATYVKENSVDRLPDFYNRWLDALRKTAPARGVALYDFNQIFDDYDGEPFRDWVHNNIGGNQIAAQRLARLAQKSAGFCSGRR